MEKAEFQGILEEVRDLFLGNLPRMMGDSALCSLPGFALPEDVNCGWCQDFACEINDRIREKRGDGFVFEERLQALDRVGNNQDYCNRGVYHWTYFFQGKYYDVECLEGVSEGRLLPYFTMTKRFIKGSRALQVFDFYRDIWRPKHVSFQQFRKEEGV